MQRSTIDYTMSVIVGRAAGGARWAQARASPGAFYAMFDSGFRPDRSAKSARSVAEAMSSHHPHGRRVDRHLVRMAQPGRCATRRWTARAASARQAMTHRRRWYQPSDPVGDGDAEGGSRRGDSRSSLTTSRSAKSRRCYWRFPTCWLNRVRGVAVGMAANIPPPA